VIDKPSHPGLSAGKAQQVQEWIAEHRDELNARWQSLQPQKS
jgi:hypothetical protein